MKPKKATRTWTEWGENLEDTVRGLASDTKMYGIMNRHDAKHLFKNPKKVRVTITVEEVEQ